MRGFHFILGAALFLTGCGVHRSPHHTGDAASVGDTNHSSPTYNGNIAPPVTYHILTNDEVIEQTHKCEAAGLDGEVWGMFDDKDDPQGTTEIRCTPRKHTDDSR